MSRKQWTTHALFSLMDHGATRALDAVTTLVFIRVMAPEALGLFSIYQSWIGLLLLFLPAIELQLFREYGALKASGRLGNELDFYGRFNRVKLFMGLIAVMALAALPTGSVAAPWRARFLLLTLAFALPFSQAFYSYMREPLRFEMRQGLVAVLSALQRVAVITALVLAALVAPGRLSVLCGAALIAYCFFAVMWRIASVSVVPDAAKPVTTEAFPGKIRHILLGSVVWIHLNGVLFQASQTFDVLALGWFLPDLAAIGRYGIALKTANFFQIIPIALSSSLGIWLGKRMGRSDSLREKRIVLASFGAMALCGLVLFGLGWVVAEPLLQFIGRGKITAEHMTQEVSLFRWLLAGVLVLASTHPMSTYLMARGKLRPLFMGLFLPWALCALVIYSLGLLSSPTVLTAAQLNLPVYGLFALFCAFHFKRS